MIKNRNTSKNQFILEWGMKFNKSKLVCKVSPSLSLQKLEITPILELIKNSRINKDTGSSFNFEAVVGTF